MRLYASLWLLRDYYSDWLILLFKRTFGLDDKFGRFMQSGRWVVVGR